MATLAISPIYSPPDLSRTRARYESDTVSSASRKTGLLIEKPAGLGPGRPSLDDQYKKAPKSPNISDGRRFMTVAEAKLSQELVTTTARAAWEEEQREKAAEAAVVLAQLTAAQTERQEAACTHESRRRF